MIEALKNLGLKSKEAAVLSFLMKNYQHPVSQYEIEQALKLRQPYVSAALRTIEHNNWVDVSMRMKQPGIMGRPENIYELIASPDQIADDLRDQYTQRSQLLKRSMKIIEGGVVWVHRNHNEIQPP